MDVRLRLHPARSGARTLPRHLPHGNPAPGALDPDAGRRPDRLSRRRPGERNDRPSGRDRRLRRVPGRPRARLSPGGGGGRRAARGHRDRARRGPPGLHRSAGPRATGPRAPRTRLRARAGRHQRGRREAREALGRPAELGSTRCTGTPARPRLPRPPSSARDRRAGRARGLGDPELGPRRRSARPAGGPRRESLRGVVRPHGDRMGTGGRWRSSDGYRGQTEAQRLRPFSQQTSPSPFRASTRASTNSRSDSRLR